MKEKAEKKREKLAAGREERPKKWRREMWREISNHISAASFIS